MAFSMAGHADVIALVIPNALVSGALKLGYPKLYGREIDDNLGAFSLEVLEDFAAVFSCLSVCVDTTWRQLLTEAAFARRGNATVATAAGGDKTTIGREEVGKGMAQISRGENRQQSYNFFPTKVMPEVVLAAYPRRTEGELTC